MASAFGHGYTGIMLSAILKWKPMPAKFWILAMLCGILPDIDALGFLLGVPYGSMFGHRGFTHSIVFAVIVGLVVVMIFFREVEPLSDDWWIMASFFFFVTVSHAVLDAMTTGGMGVAFFAPFNNSRYFFGWRPILVSPIGVGSFFNEWGRRVLISEATWIGLPLCGAWIVSRIVRKVVS